MSGKRKTTFAKLARESRLRARRLEKQAKKAARRRASEDHPTQRTDTAAAGDEGAGNAGEFVQLPGLRPSLPKDQRIST